MHFFCLEFLNIYSVAICVKCTVIIKEKSTVKSQVLLSCTKDVFTYLAIVCLLSCSFKTIETNNYEQWYKIICFFSG